MKKFYNVQRFSGILPFFSTAMVFAVSIVELARHKAEKALWWKFVFAALASLAITGAVCFVSVQLLNSRLAIFCAALILAGTNPVFALLQKKAAEARGMDMNSKVPVYFIPVFFCTLGFAASVVPFILGVGELINEYSTIKDTNGLFDTRVAVIDEESICSDISGYSAQMKKISFAGGDSDLGGALGEFDRDECSLSVRKMSGVMTLQATETDADSMALRFESSLDNGNMEIFVVVDGEIFNSVPIGRPVTIRLEDIAGKTVLVRVAAESAAFEVSVKRELG